MISSKKVKTPLGEATLAAENEALIGFWFDDQKYFGFVSGKDKSAEFESNGECKVFGKAEKWLSDYFAGKAGKINFELAPKGTEFQQKIWKMLLEIPSGKLTTYGEIAKSYAKENGLQSMSAQAVGGAVGHNPISVIIPCHRVVGASKSLTGYAGGIEKKKALLSLEKCNVDGEIFTF